MPFNTYSLDHACKDKTLVSEIFCAAMGFANRKAVAHTMLAAAFQFASDDKALARAKIHDGIQKNFKNTTSNIIQLSAAGKAFYQMLDEFLKNSIDAGATEIAFNYSNNDGQIAIHIVDNGTMEISPKKLGYYNWRQALLSNSAKNDSSQMGGANLGLAIIAYWLEKNGQGALSLNKKSADEKGAVVTLTSLCATRGDIDVMPEGLNLKHEMIYDFITQSSTVSKEEIEAVKTRHPDFPENYQSAQKRQAETASAKPFFMGPPNRKKRESACSSSIFSNSSSAMSSPLNPFSPASNGTNREVSSDGLGVSPLPATSPF